MICPLAKMYTLGSGFIPSANHAGGLRYHGMSSVVSQLYDDKLIEAVSVEQTEVFAAAEQFARVEGILPAPESSHAIRVAIDEALKCKETGGRKNYRLRIDRNRLFRYGGIWKIQRRRNDGLHPNRRRSGAWICRAPKRRLIQKQICQKRPRTKKVRGHFNSITLQSRPLPEKDLHRLFRWQPYETP